MKEKKNNIAEKDQRILINTKKKERKKERREIDRKRNEE